MGRTTGTVNGTLADLVCRNPLKPFKHRDITFFTPMTKVLDWVADELKEEFEVTWDY